MFAVRFGENIARTDVEQEAGKKSEVPHEEPRIDGKSKRGERAEYGRSRVEEEEEPCTLRRIFIEKDERHGIHAVRKIVRDDGERNEEARRGIHLEPKPYSHAVHETMPNKRKGGGDTHLGM